MTERASNASRAGTDDVAGAARRGVRRADARRNRETLLVAANEAFAVDGASATLEGIARRAGVGIGTLYRHFPSRKDLYEAVYVHEVEALCRSAADVARRPPWDALEAWLRRFVGYLATKRAVVEELANESELLASCRSAIADAGGPLLDRAQAAGDARADVSFDDVLRLVMGITLVQGDDARQLDRLLNVALDGISAPRAR